MINSFQNHHMKDILDARQRASLMRSGLIGLAITLVLTWFQTRRIKRAQRVAEESQQRFDAFMNHTPAIAFIKDECGRVVYMNKAQHMNNDLPCSAGRADIAAQLQGEDSAVWDSNRSVEVTETVTLPSGERRHFLCLKFPFVNLAGQRFLGSVALDITQRKEAEEALRFSQFSIDRSPDSILWIDSKGRIFYANEAACRRLEFTREEMLELTVYDIDSGFKTFSKNRDEIKKLGSLTLESEFRTRNGSAFPVELALYHLEFDGSDFICCISRDITERKRAEGELSHQARHDLLTALPNRRHFETQLSQRIEAARLTGQGLAVLYFDLDGFKLINDTLGHSLGDALLKQLVRRMETCVRDTDVLARMGGDEFTVIASGVNTRESAELVADKLLSSLRESFLLDGHELLVTASLGVSLYPADGLDGAALLQHADAAMYEAKREGKNRIRFFTPEMNAVVRERLELENHLRRALDKGELSLHYQPEISLKTNKVVRYEALLRWSHPAFGNIPPVKFIHIAEETGLIVPIGAWVLREACRHTKRLFDFGVTVGIGVNVSSMQFVRPDFVDTVTRTLRETGLPSHLLEIELTETIVMQGIDEVARKIAQLRALGVSVSIDDFGTGYSSLSYLQKLRIDNLKIDRSFICDIPSDRDAMTLTRALISLAHSLGMKVVVEGIETKEQLDAIRAMGCDMAQGFLLGRPAPAALGPEPVLEYELAETA